MDGAWQEGGFARTVIEVAPNFGVGLRAASLDQKFAWQGAMQVQGTVQPWLDGGLAWCEGVVGEGVVGLWRGVGGFLQWSKTIRAGSRLKH